MADETVTGYVHAVNTTPIGGMLSEDAPNGSTELTVEDAADFNAAGGTVVLRGGTDDPDGALVEETVTYVECDDDLGALTLASPLVNSFFTDDRVDVWDPTTGSAVVETVAQVAMVGDEQNADTVEATVEHALVPYLAEGIRTDETMEAVSMLWRGGTLYVVDLLGLVPIMDGSMIDPDTLPEGGGVAPSVPTTPEAPTVLGGVASMLVRWGAVTHPNPVTYRVYVSPDTPVVVSADTFVGEVSGTMLTVRQLPVEDGETEEPFTGLDYDTVYYVAVQAVDSFDEDGTNVSPLSPEGEGSPMQINSADIAARQVAAENIQVGSLTGELLASELAVSNKFTTSVEGGQRVEFDPDGIRLHGSEDELLINMPTESGQDPSFRGRIDADGLTVREGATFYSPLNEFARESVINLAEQVAPPVSPPGISVSWPSVALTQAERTGVAGTFALDFSQVTGVGYDAENNRILVAQYRPAAAGKLGTTRVWFYTPAGGISTIMDLRNAKCTGIAYSASGVLKMLLRGTVNDSTNWYVWDGARGDYRVYTTGYNVADVTMGFDGTDILIAETTSAGTTRFRRLDTSTNPVSFKETTISSGIAPLTTRPCFVFRGAADMGSTKWVMSYQNQFAFRAFTASGAYDEANNWESPTSKLGAFWHPTNQKFYTLGSNGRLYEHTELRWTDPALNTWHIGQTFFKDGTGLETALGGVASFAMKKRALLTITPAVVPYSGEAEDPDAWQLYGKRGAAPTSNGSDMYAMAQGWWSKPTWVTATPPPTFGATPPAFSTFPGGTPARMRSQRTMPSDSAKSVLELRGDGSGHWGGLEVNQEGKWQWGNGPQPITPASGYTSGNALAMFEPGGTHVSLMGTLSRSPLQRGATIGTLPEEFRPTQQRRVMCALGTSEPGSGQSGTTVVTINSSGSIWLTGASNVVTAQTVAYLDGVRYPI